MLSPSAVSGLGQKEPVCTNDITAAQTVQNDGHLASDCHKVGVQGKSSGQHVERQTELLKTTNDQRSYVTKAADKTLQNEILVGPEIKTTSEVDSATSESGTGGTSGKTTSVAHQEQEALDVVGSHDGSSNSKSLATDLIDKKLELLNDGGRSDTPTKKQFKSEFKTGEEVRDWSHELLQGYRILREIMVDHYKNISWPFLDPVDVEGENLWDYHDRVKHPMWLRRIKDKFHNSSYNSITEFVGDMRRVIENCYRYNGINHYVSKQAQKMEKVLEQKLALLSKTLRDKTTLHMTSGGMYGEDPNSKRRSVARSLQVPPDQTGSVILTYIRKEIEAQEKEERRLRELEKREEWQKQQQEIIDWEEKLLDGTHLKELWEIPAIGHFLCLAQQTLNIPEVMFYELERGLAMPQASSTLAMVYSYLLSTPYQRTRLAKKPFMPYCVWNQKLHERVQEWYDIFDEKETYEDAADYIGISPDFFLELGEENPLNDKQYHELPFRQRVWILKSLCDNVYWSEIEIQEMVDRQPVFEQREVILGYDADGCAYLHFPQFCGADLRIYKQRPLPVPSLQKTLKKSKRNLELNTIKSPQADQKQTEGDVKHNSAGSRQKEDTKTTDEGEEDVSHHSDPVNTSSLEEGHNGCEAHLDSNDDKVEMPLVEREKEAVQVDAKGQRTMDSEDEIILDHSQSQLNSRARISNSTHEHSKVNCKETSVERLPAGCFHLKRSGDCSQLTEDVAESDRKVKKRKHPSRNRDCQKSNLTTILSPLPCDGKMLRTSKRNRVVFHNQDSASPDVGEMEECMSPRRSKRQKNKVEMYTSPDPRQQTSKNMEKKADAVTGKISPSKKKRKKRRTKGKANSFKDISVEERPEFVTACESVEDLRSLTAQFAQPTVEDARKCKKSGKSPHRKRCVVELHQVLLNLLTELEPWEQKLVKARTKARNKLLTEWRDFQTTPPGNGEVINVWDSEEEGMETDGEELQEELGPSKEDGGRADPDQKWSSGSKRAAPAPGTKEELGRLRPRKRICERGTISENTAKEEQVAKEPVASTSNIWASLQGTSGQFPSAQPQTAAQLLLSMKTKCSVGSVQPAQTTVNKVSSHNRVSTAPPIIQQDGRPVLQPKMSAIRSQQMTSKQAGATNLNVPSMQMSFKQQVVTQGVKRSPQVPQILQLQTSGSSQPVYLLQQINNQGQVVYLQLQPTPSLVATTAPNNRPAHVQTVKDSSKAVLVTSQVTTSASSPQGLKPNQSSALFKSQLKPKSHSETHEGNVSTVTTQHQANLMTKTSGVGGKDSTVLSWATPHVLSKRLQSQACAGSSASTVQQHHTPTGHHHVNTSPGTVSAHIVGNLQLTPASLKPTVLQQNARMPPAIVKSCVTGSQVCPTVVIPLAKGAPQLTTGSQLTKEASGSTRQVLSTAQHKLVRAELVQRGANSVSSEVKLNPTNLHDVPMGSQVNTGPSVVQTGTKCPLTTPFVAQVTKVVHTSTCTPTVQRGSLAPSAGPNISQFQQRLQLVQLKTVPLHGKSQGQTTATMCSTASHSATANASAQVMHFKLSPVILSPAHTMPPKDIDGSSFITSPPKTKHPIPRTNSQVCHQLSNTTTALTVTTPLKPTSSRNDNQPSVDRQLIVKPQVGPFLQLSHQVSPNGLLLQTQATMAQAPASESPGVVHVSHGSHKQISKVLTQGASNTALSHSLTAHTCVSSVTVADKPSPQEKLQTIVTPAKSTFSSVNTTVQKQLTATQTRQVVTPLLVRHESKGLGQESWKLKQTEVQSKVPEENMLTSVRGTEQSSPSKTPVGPTQPPLTKWVQVQHTAPSVSRLPGPVQQASTPAMPQQTHISLATSNPARYSAGQPPTLTISPSVLQGLPVHHTSGGLSYVQLLLDQGGVKTVMALPVQMQPGKKVNIPQMQSGQKVTIQPGSLKTSVPSHSKTAKVMNEPSGRVEGLQTITSHLQGHVFDSRSSVQPLKHNPMAASKQGTACLGSTATEHLTLSGPESLGKSSGNQNQSADSDFSQANEKIQTVSTTVCYVGPSSTLLSVPTNPPQPAGASTHVVSHTLCAPIMSPSMEQSKGHAESSVVSQGHSSVDSLNTVRKTV